MTENVKKRLKGEAIPNKYELDIISKDGIIVPVEISASIIEYEGRLAVMAIIRDITERKRAEKELVDTKNYLDMIISMSYDGIFVIDDEGKFEFCNDACVEISGYQKKEYIGKSFMGLIPEEYTQFMLDRWHEAQAGECEPYETVILRKDGTRRNLLVSRGNFMLDKQQKYCVIIKDVTTDYAGYIGMILKDMKGNSED